MESTQVVGQVTPEESNEGKKLAIFREYGWVSGKTVDVSAEDQQITTLTSTVDRIAEDSPISEADKVKLIMHSASLACGVAAAQPFPFADISS